MILQVLAHSGEIHHRLDPERLQFAGVADPGELEQLGELIAPPQTMTSPARTRRLDLLPAGPEVDADGAVAFEDEAAHERPALHVQIRLPMTGCR